MPETLRDPLAVGCCNSHCHCLRGVDERCLRTRKDAMDLGYDYPRKLLEGLLLPQ